MALLKEITIEAIKKLPDECSLEDIMYEISFVAQVFEGLRDAENGKLLTTEELLNRIVYRIIEGTEDVEILTVMHGAREIKTAFRQEWEF